LASSFVPAYLLNSVSERCDEAFQSPSAEAVRQPTRRSSDCTSFVISCGDRLGCDEVGRRRRPLDAIKAKPGRVCPLVCDHGFKADGDACVKIACRAGYRVNDENECEKVQEKSR